MVPLSIPLLAAIGAKLIGPYGGLQVDKKKVCDVTGLRGLTLVKYFCDVTSQKFKGLVRVSPRKSQPEKRPK